MKYILILSVAVNIFLLMKLIAMRLSIREIRTDFTEKGSLNSNTLLRISSRDKEIRSLAEAMNETLVSLRDAFHKYERGDAEIKAAITNIAHDLRTPLTAICGYLELGEKLDKSPELERYLSVIAERAGHMKKLTEELFEYALISGGEIREEEQELIQKALERLTSGKTTFAIAHRLSTLKNADRIMVIDGHHIAEIGTHKELLARKGIYFNLFTAQIS